MCTSNSPITPTSYGVVLRVDQRMDIRHAQHRHGAWRHVGRGMHDLERGARRIGQHSGECGVLAALQQHRVLERRPSL